MAISLTILNLNKGGYDGFQLFKFTVQKRVSFKDPNTVFSTYCKSEKNKDSFKFCMESLKDTEDTLKANRFLVTTKYFFIKEFLPWFHSDFSELTSNDKF